MKIILSTSRLILIYLSTLLFVASAFGQVQYLPTAAKNKNPFPVKYTSEIDEKLNLRTITLAPVYDNVKKVYAEPIQKLLMLLFQKLRKFFLKK